MLKVASIIAPINNRTGREYGSHSGDLFVCRFDAGVDKSGASVKCSAAQAGDVGRLINEVPALPPTVENSDTAPGRISLADI